jgi:hypothetical protein
MLAAFDGDDHGIGRFAASRQFASDLRGMLQCAVIASTRFGRAKCSVVYLKSLYMIM